MRAARQQDFLRQAKQQVTVAKLIDERDRLMKIFGRNTHRPTRPALALRGAAAAEARALLGRPADPEIHFEGAIGPSYVEASNEQVKKLVQQFLERRGHPGPARRGRGARTGTRKRRKRRPADADVDRPRRRHRARRGPGPPGRPGRAPAARCPSSTRPLAPELLRVRRTRRASTRSARTDGKRYRAYRMVMRKSSANGEYYGLQGTTWKDPPILDDPTETRAIGGREYELHFDGRPAAARRLADRRRPSTGSRTRCCRRSPSKQMMGIARSVRRCC